MSFLKSLFIIIIFVLVFTGCYSSIGSYSSSKSSKSSKSKKQKANYLLVAVPSYEKDSINDIANIYKNNLNDELQINLAATAKIDFNTYLIQNDGTHEDVTNDTKIKSDSKLFKISGKTITLNPMPAGNEINQGILSMSYKHKYKGNLKITVVDIPVCGNGLGRGIGINDKNQENAKGPCIKVSSRASSLFTASPSEAIIKIMGYKQIATWKHSDDHLYKNPEHHETNHTYIGVSNGFAQFNTMPGDVIREMNWNEFNNTQYAKFCADLKIKKFGRITTWNVVNDYSVSDDTTYGVIAVFKSFISDSNKENKNIYGWPMGDYWHYSATAGSHFPSWRGYVDSATGISSIREPEKAKFISCYSPR